MREKFEYKRRMTKFNSLRSLKKRRKSVDKRGSVKKDRRKVDRRILEEHHNKEPEEEATTAVNEVAKDEPAKHDEQSKEWFPWWNGSVLTDFYSWCQSTVTEVSLYIDTEDSNPRVPGVCRSRGRARLSYISNTIHHMP